MWSLGHPGEMRFLRSFAMKVQRQDEQRQGGEQDPGQKCQQHDTCHLGAPLSILFIAICDAGD